MIDLGEVRAGLPEPAPPRAPLPYRWLLGSLVLLLVAGLAGAAPAPPAPAPPVIIPLTLRDGFRVDEGRLHLIGPGVSAAGEPAITRLRTYTFRSYDLPGGHLLSTYTATVDGDIIYAGDGLDGVLLLSSQATTSGAHGIIAVRPGSGGPVWRRDAYLHGVSADRGTALVVDDAVTRVGPDQEWQGLDTRTGAIRWRVRQPAGGHLTLRMSDRDAARYPALIYTLGPDGRIEARDTMTGEIAASVRTPIPVDQDTQFWSSSGVLMVGHPAAGTIAYDERGLSERWRRAAPGLSENTFPYACGVVICLIGRQNGMAAIDPATGLELWHHAGWEITSPIGEHLLAGTASQVEPRLSVVDPRTGRVVAEAGAWVSAGPGPSPDTAYVYRIRNTDNRMWYGVLRLRTGKVRLLGSADRIAGDCRFESGVLICRLLDSSVAVWRL